MPCRCREMRGAGRFRQRPTPVAWVLIGVTGVLLLMAANYQNNVAYLLCSGVIAVAVMASLEARRNLRGLALVAGRVQPVFAGEECRLPLRITGVATADERLLLDVSAILAGVSGFGSLDSLTADTGFSLCFPALPRGVHHLRSCRLGSDYPFGLLRTEIERPLIAEVVIYPAARGTLALPGGGGDDEGARRGRGDFTGHRAYQPGDPPQRIDWKASARSADELLTKQFEEGAGQREHRLDLAELRPLDLETALEQLACWVCQAEAAAQAYRLCLGVETAEPARQGPEQRQRCLEALARHGTDPA